MTWLMILAVAVLFYTLGFAHGSYKGFEAGMVTSHEVSTIAAYELYESLMEEARKK